MRVAKTEGRSLGHRCTAALDFAYERLALKLRRGGNAEVLFAQRAVLCEGQDDVAVVRVLLERLACDPDSRSISVVDCGGRENLPDYIRLLDELHIPVLVVSDGDATKAAQNEKVAGNVKKVADAAGDRAVVFGEDLETALGTTKQRSNTAHVVELAEAVDMDSAGEEIDALMSALREFCLPRGKAQLPARAASPQADLRLRRREAPTEAPYTAPNRRAESGRDSLA